MRNIHRHFTICSAHVHDFRRHWGHSDPAMTRKDLLLLWSPRILGIGMSLFLSLFALDAFEGGKPLAVGADRFRGSPRAGRRGAGDRRAVVAPAMDWRSGVRPARRGVWTDRQFSPRLDPADLRSAADGRRAVSVELASSPAAQRELRKLHFRRLPWGDFCRPADTQAGNTGSEHQ